MTKLEIINMVANHYNSYNRGMGHHGCNYRTDDGKMCAVGMCMNDEAMDEYGDYVGSISEISGKIINRGGYLDSIFKEEYRGHDVDFWDDLQRLHDHSSFWSDEGLSEAGEKEVEALIKEYIDDNT